MRAMTRDYAGRTTAAKRAGAEQRPRAQPRRNRAATRKQSPGKRKAITFSAPSFSAGAVFGAALVLLLANLPGFFRGTVEVIRGEVAETSQPELEFRFNEILENAEVVVDPDAYFSGRPQSPADVSGHAYLLQAASFREMADARNLQTRLGKLGMPAATDTVRLENGTWYRVTVGPYPSKVEAQRALTRLRENRLSAYFVQRG
jgi:septal ring-binding cell division protein DamX